MPDLTTTFELTPKQVLASYWACHRLAHALRWAVGIGAPVAGALTGQLHLGVFGPIFFVFYGLAVRRELRPWTSATHSYAATISEEHYRVEGQGMDTSLAWTAMTGASRVRGHWVLRISPSRAGSIPTDALDATQTAAFVDLLRRKQLLAG